MNISIAGVHMDTSDALRTHAQSKLDEVTGYFDQVQDVTVKFTHEPHHNYMHKADITMYANGLILRAEGNGADYYAAVDTAATKIAKQLKKYKGKLQHRRAKQKEFKEQIRDLGPLAFEDTAMMNGASMSHDDDDDLAVGQYSEFAPDIAKKEVSKIAPMTVDEAVMQMDLLHKPAFLFMNSDTNELNMVYREGENAVRWVAPKAA